MDGRAKIVPEAGKRQFECARGAAGNGLGLEHLDLEPGLGEDNGGSEAVGARTDDAGFRKVSWHFAPGSCWTRSSRESQPPMLRAKCQSPNLVPGLQIGHLDDLDAPIRLPLQSWRIR